MSVVYIAGGITGVKDYRRHFQLAEGRLLFAGYTVFNPTVLPDGLSWNAYMPICYAMMDACDTAYFLRGWEHSKGARLEFEYAMAKGMKIEFEERDAP